MQPLHKLPRVEHLSLSQAASTSREDSAKLYALVLEARGLPCSDVEHKLRVLGERLPNVEVVDRVLSDSEDQRIDEIHVHFVIHLLFVGKLVARVDNKFANVDL